MMRQYDQRIARICQQDERCRRLVKVEGVGPLVETAVIAAIGNARQFTETQRLAGAGAARAFQRRTILLGISQARQSLSAHAAHPRGTSCCTRGRAQTRRAKHLGESA